MMIHEDHENALMEKNYFRAFVILEIASIRFCCEAA
jgi:hypothetical protein